MSRRKPLPRLGGNVPPPVATGSRVSDELLVVTLLPAGRGARFDVDQVQAEWRAAS